LGEQLINNDIKNFKYADLALCIGIKTTAIVLDEFLLLHYHTTTSYSLLTRLNNVSLVKVVVLGFYDQQHRMFLINVGRVDSAVCTYLSCISHYKLHLALTLAMMFVATVSIATTHDNALKQEVAALKKEVASIKREIKTKPSYERAQPLNNQFATNESQSLSAQWMNASSVAHLSGYADAGYVDPQNEHSHFFFGHFNPIFHYLYKDLILAEAELELEIDSDGETEVKLEYADLALFLNNYMILIVGKFQSPLGFFFQNLHPTWINKLPSSPPGFRGDQASPEADIGVQLRGGFPVGNPIFVNYAIYVANGPKAIVEDDEIEEIEAEGFNSDVDGKKVVGGRIGILPVPQVEIGMSAATGDVGLFDEDTDERIEKHRHYTVLGGDLTVRIKNLRLHGEIIQQKVHSRSSSDISGGKWKGWYGQASYRFQPTKIEAIVRYGEYHTPHARQKLEQWMIGVDYWFAPSVVAKVGYEFNRGLRGTTNNNNRFLFQLAYGF